MSYADFFADPATLAPGDVVQLDSDDVKGHRVVQVDPRADDLGGGHAVIVVPLAGGKREHYHFPPRARVWRHHGQHWQACGRCGELYPCAELRAEREVEEFRRRLDRICAHCGDEVTPGQWSVCGEGRIWHNRRAKGCREAAANALGTNLERADPTARSSPYVPNPKWPEFPR